MPIFWGDQRLVHMGRGDAYVWSKFLNLHEKEYFNYQYDVRVGQPVIMDPAWPEWVKKSAEALSQKRIDVVMENKSSIFVVEVKVSARARAIGDLISYRNLYHTRFVPNKPVRPFLVAAQIDTDALYTIKELNMLYEIV